MVQLVKDLPCGTIFTLNSSSTIYTKVSYLNSYNNCITAAFSVFRKSRSGLKKVRYFKQIIGTRVVADVVGKSERIGLS